MANDKKYTIYAAPRALDGRYRRCDDKPLFKRDFKSLDAMQKFWSNHVVPATSNAFGLAYELSMVEADHVMWDFIGDPRYADEPVLTGSTSGGHNKLMYRFRNLGLCQEADPPLPVQSRTAKSR